MKADFDSGFADSLEERIGSVLFALREKNVDYRSLTDEHAALLNGKYNSVKEYKKALSQAENFSSSISAICTRSVVQSNASIEQLFNSAYLKKIADVFDKIADIEKRYLFLAGMREHARMEDTLSSDEFEKLFTE